MRPETIITFLIIFLLQFGIVNALEAHKTEIVLEDSGNAVVTNLFFINSENTTSFFLPVFNPLIINVYDEKGSLDYSYSNGSLTIDIREQRDGYSFTVSYVTDELTSKNGSEWVLSYDFYRLRDFDTVIFTLTLPENTFLRYFSPDSIVYSEGGMIKIDWDIGEDESSKNILVRYSFKQAPDGMIDLSYIYIIIPVIIIALLVLLQKRRKFRIKHKKDFSSGQKDLMHTLTENEKAIVSELFKSKKPITQKKLTMTTGIPKATMSRTLKKLEAKKLIEIKDYGTTKMIVLTEWFLEK